MISYTINAWMLCPPPGASQLYPGKSEKLENEHGSHLTGTAIRHSAGERHSMPPSTPQANTQH